MSGSQAQLPVTIVDPVPLLMPGAIGDAYDSLQDENIIVSPLNLPL